MQTRTSCLVVAALSGVAVGALSAEAQVQKAFVNPAGGYTQVVTVEDRGVKTVYVSGQVGRGADLREHAESAFSGVAAQLSAAGASMRDVVKIRIYVTDFDPADYRVISAARLAAFPDDAWPASTMLGSVAGWALLGLMQFLPSGVASRGAGPLAAAGVAMLVAGLLACIVPAAKALAVHPVRALRQD
jgi:2-iminobutanoate/2-iminopropanoate deaminase